MIAADRPSSISFQTAKLAGGRHTSAGEGVCVVELASMIAGERFSDRPRAVCPVLAAYMRMVNDTIVNERLPELLPFAAALVGTRSSRRERRERARSCARWALEMGETARLGPFALGERWWGGRRAGSTCAVAAMRRGGPDLALALVELLLRESEASGEDEEATPAPGQAPAGDPSRPGW